MNNTSINCTGYGREGNNATKKRERQFKGREH